MNTPPEAAAALADHGPTRVADRGHTRIAERVIEKIAARAATDVERTGGAARQVLGVAVGRAGPAGPARAEAMVDGDVTSVRVALSVRWPAPVREVGRQVRAHVTEQVTTLTGLTVAEVDVDVTELLSPARVEAARRRVV